MRHLHNLFLIIFLISLGCSTVEKKYDADDIPDIEIEDTGEIDDTSNIDEPKIKGEKNFYIHIYDSDIANSEDDRRCYYTIYINKIESGRTTTGLESQEKTFETVLSPDKHLVKVEKWVLNENLGRYIKVNNIDQPKPDFIYVDIKRNDTIRVKLKSSKAGVAEYTIE